MLRLLAAARKSLLLVALGLLLAFVVTGIVASYALAAARSPLARARALHADGKYAEAEVQYLTAAKQENVDVPLLVELLDNHAVVAHEAGDDPEAAASSEGPIVTLLTDGELARDVGLLGAYWYKVTVGDDASDARAMVLAAADGEPPMPWANHLVAREIASSEPRVAAARYEREGRAFPEREADIDLALRVYVALGAWDEVRRLLDDPLSSSAASADVQFKYAVHDRRWLAAARWFVPHLYSDASLRVVLLAAVAALGWFFFCTKVGLLRERLRLRGPLYGVSFALGVASIYPTVLIGMLEEHFLGLRETGGALADLVYFVAGVGAREELCKFFLFLPLLPILKKFATKREAVACGALVGLGFAAEENIAHLAHNGLSHALTRFLSANFLHIATTAIVAAAAFDLVAEKRDKDTRVIALSRAVALVIVTHGVYDFVIANEAFQSFSFVSVLALVVLARLFLTEVRGLRGTEGQGALLYRFVIATVVVLGASYVYGSLLVGPAPALKEMLQGFIGLAIWFIIFIRELVTRS